MTNETRPTKPRRTRSQIIEFPPAEPITVCAACGEKFRPRQKWTLAAWFKCGPVTLNAIVHVPCRHKPWPKPRRQPR